MSASDRSQMDRRSDRAEPAGSGDWDIEVGGPAEEKMPPAEVERYKREIDKLDQVELAYWFRFGRVGHPFFRPELWEYFTTRFESLGGMTPQVSKRIGW